MIKLRGHHVLTLIATVGVAGCMPATTGGLGGGPPTLCTNMPSTPSIQGNILRCEDFRAVPEGNLPQGWSGGAGLMVKQDPDERRAVLRTAEPREQYNLTIPWSFGGDYRLDASIKPCLGLQLAIGDVKLTFDTKPGYAAGYYVGLQGGAAPATWEVVQPYDKSYWGLTLTKSGDVYKVTLGSKQVALGRYEGLPDPQNINVTATCPFGLGGIRVDGPPPSAPAAAAPARPAAPAPGAPATSAPPASESPFGPAPKAAAAKATGAIVVRADDASDAQFAFVVDGQPVAGTFRTTVGGEVSFTLPAGHVQWSHVDSACDEGGDAERQFDLKPGAKHVLECWASNKMGTCCLFGGVGGKPAP